MISSSVMIISGRNSGLHTVSRSRQSFTRSRNICSLELAQFPGRLYLVQPVQRQLQRVQEPAFPCPVDSVLRVPAGPAVVGPAFNGEVLRVYRLIARLHGRAVLVEVGCHIACLSRRGRLCGASGSSERCRGLDGVLGWSSGCVCLAGCYFALPQGSRAALSWRPLVISECLVKLSSSHKDIYISDYYYDSGHSQMPTGSPRPGRSKKNRRYFTGGHCELG